MKFCLQGSLSPALGQTRAAFPLIMSFIGLAAILEFIEHPYSTCTSTLKYLHILTRCQNTPKKQRHLHWHMKIPCLFNKELSRGVEGDFPKSD